MNENLACMIAPLGGMVAHRPPNRALTAGLGRPYQSSRSRRALPMRASSWNLAGLALANRRLLHLHSRSILVARGDRALAVIRHRQTSHQRLLDALLHRRQ